MSSSRPQSQGLNGAGQGQRPSSTTESTGVRSVTAQSQRSDSGCVGEVAAELTSSMMSRALESPANPGGGGLSPVHSAVEAEGGRGDAAELSVLRHEVAGARADEQAAQKTIEELSGTLAAALSDLQDARGQLERRTAEATQLQDTLAQREMQLSDSQEEAEKLRATAGGGAAGAAGVEESASLRGRVSELEGLLAERSKEVPSTQPTLELPAEGSEDQPLLAAAYQQISVLNTQLAHLYTELTMARTEAQHLRGTSGVASNNNSQMDSPEKEGDLQKQSQQIADLVGDIRHLQLDLEYHQQKLDQMLEEKQKMMKELKKSRGELLEAKQLAEEREQLLRHREVDLQQMKQKLEAKGDPGGGAGGLEGSAVAALRTEAAAKDSALIVSHYELHKEKLLRDRLEQKNMKLMERMQKLMMVVETMRKENLSLEKVVKQTGKAHDEKDEKLRQVTQKAKQLQRLNRGNRSGAQSAEPDAQKQMLPPLTQRSLDSDMSM